MQDCAGARHQGGRVSIVHSGVKSDDLSLQTKSYARLSGSLCLDRHSSMLLSCSLRVYETMRRGRERESVCVCATEEGKRTGFISFLSHPGLHTRIRNRIPFYFIKNKGKEKKKMKNRADSPATKRSIIIIILITVHSCYSATSSRSRRNSRNRGRSRK
jgi:hypothetical protein